MSTQAPQSVQLRSLLPSIAFNAVVPLVVYTLVRPYFASDVSALVVAGAIPLLMTVGGFLVRRKVNAIGVMSVIGFVVAVVVQLLTGGDGFIVKIKGVLITGPVGVIFLLSALIGRPLIGVIFRYLARRNPNRRLPNHHQSTVTTLLIGGMLTLSAAATVVMALTLPTTVYLALSDVVGLGIVGLGFLAIFLVRRRWAAQREAAESVQQA
ncbi:VC0807 family protein [Kutzneria sp. NPDC052558]|uniref:VC0807 family protein n=1 Tax=Kutzneria sp. NPDC052558 TaxID=3364121 RepID=UPI0037C98575